MAWHPSGAKPLSKPTVIWFFDGDMRSASMSYAVTMLHNHGYEALAVST